MQKFKYLFTLIGIWVMFMCTIKVEASNTPREMVAMYVNAINMQNWSEFTELYCNDEKAIMEDFFSNTENALNKVGIFNVKSANLVEVVEIDVEDAQIMLNKDYTEREAKVFVFGVDFEVHEDSKYFSTGINYNFITFIKENGVWKVSEMIPILKPEYLVELGYKFSDKYNIAINVMDARMKGILMNYKGEEFADLNGNPISEGISTQAIINQRTIPTASTIVRYRNSNGSNENIYFHDYCLGVLAGEVRAYAFDGVVRQAQAIAIKTFTWHYIIVPHGAAAGYDVNYVQQSYRPDKISENSKVTTDYNAVKDVWMESYEGYIFTAYYKAGVYVNQSNHQYGGEFKQEGARWLFDNQVCFTYKDLLKYYYDYSPLSEGEIRFFDNNKTQLY